MNKSFLVVIPGSKWGECVGIESISQTKVSIYNSISKPSELDKKYIDLFENFVNKFNEYGVEFTKEYGVANV